MCCVCRDFQDFKYTDVPGYPEKGYQPLAGPIQVFLHPETMDTVSKAFSYLTEPPEFIDDERQYLRRRITYLGPNLLAHCVCGVA
jgi:hypothetical protein